MDIQNWIKQNKVAAAALSAGGLFYILHKGHTANSTTDVTSSDGTATGAAADGQHVQLIPVSSDSAGTSVDNGNGVDQIPTTVDPSTAQQNQSNEFQDFNDFLNLEKQYSAGQTVTASDPGPVDTPAPAATAINPPSGPAASGAISAAVAQNATTNPSGHPGYTTVIKNSSKYGKPYVYHQEIRPGGHVVDIPIRPATHAPPPPPPPPPRKAPPPKRHK